MNLKALVGAGIIIAIVVNIITIERWAKDQRKRYPTSKAKSKQGVKTTNFISKIKKYFTIGL